MNFWTQLYALNATTADVGAKMNLSFKTVHSHLSLLRFPLCISAGLQETQTGLILEWQGVSVCVHACFLYIAPLICSQFVLRSCGVTAPCWKIGQTRSSAALMSYLVSSRIYDSKLHCAPSCCRETTWHVSLDLNNDWLSFSAELDKHVVVSSEAAASALYEYLFSKAGYTACYRWSVLMVENQSYKVSY